MVWDATLPLNSESEKLGDNRIREVGDDLQSSLEVEGVFPGPNYLTAPVFFSQILYGATGDRPAAAAAYEGRWYYNTTTRTIQRQNGALTWDSITCPTDLIPSGSSMVFYQQTASSGWVQVTDAAIDDAIPRVTAGAGAGNGGVDSIKTVPTHDHGGVTATTDISHIHLNSANPSSPARSSSSNPTTENQPSILFSSDLATETGLANISLDHLHVINAVVGFQPGYIDVIVATKI